MYSKTLTNVVSLIRVMLYDENVRLVKEKMYH